VNPAAKVSTRIAVQGIAVKRIALIKRIGFKLFIVSTLKPKSALANRVASGFIPIRNQNQFLDGQGKDLNTLSHRPVDSLWECPLDRRAALPESARLAARSCGPSL